MRYAITMISLGILLSACSEPTVNQETTQRCPDNSEEIRAFMKNQIALWEERGDNKRANEIRERMEEWELTRESRLDENGCYIITPNDRLRMAGTGH